MSRTCMTWPSHPDFLQLTHLEYCYYANKFFNCSNRSLRFTTWHLHAKRLLRIICDPRSIHKCAVMLKIFINEKARHVGRDQIPKGFFLFPWYIDTTKNKTIFFQMCAWSCLSTLINITCWQLKNVLMNTCYETNTWMRTIKAIVAIKTHW